MQKFILFGGIAIAAIAMLSLTASLTAREAPNGITGSNITATLNEADDFRVEGSDVRLSGQVGGELFVRTARFEISDISAGQIEAYSSEAMLSGTIDAPTILHATSIHSTAVMNGPVEFHTLNLDLGGALNAPAQINMVDGQFGGHFSRLTLRGNDVSFTDRSNVDESLDISARDLVLEGRINGRLVASVRSLRLGGMVSGFTSINAHPGVEPDAAMDGRVEIAGTIDDARVCAASLVVSGDIRGTLTVSTDSEPVFESGGRAAHVVYTPRVEGRCRYG